MLAVPMRSLTTSLGDAIREHDVESLHKARVASRRIREVLPVVPGKAGRGKLRRRIRRITRQLGPVRELDVSQAVLDQLRDRRVVTDDTIAPLRTALAAERQMRWDELRERLSGTNLDKLRRQAKRAEDLASVRPRRQLVVRAWGRAGKRALALRAAIVSAGGLYLPDRLHDVRIAAKKLRYALELVQSVGQIQMASRLKALRQTQDLLGRMHDVEMVIARIRTVQGTPGRANLRVSADLDCAVRALEDECRRHHGGYVAMREALLKLTDAVESGAAREVEA